MHSQEMSSKLDYLISITVLHQRLLQKLTLFGIHDNVLKWIESIAENIIYIVENNKLYLIVIVLLHFGY